MFKKLQIKNFQSHKDTTIEFDKGINIIKGVSNHGKTAILRALNWVINNKPDGDSYRSWWGGDTEVTLTLADGTEIIRRRTDKVNEYQIKETHYTALNRGVPEDIQALINMNDVNIQNQLESVFLLNKTSGEIAKTLNNTVDLGIIDDTIANITQEYNQVNSAIKQGKEQIAYYVRELYKYKDLDNITKALAELEVNEKALTQLTAEINDCNTLIKSLFTLSETADEIEDKIKYDSTMKTALETLVNIQMGISTLKKESSETDRIITLLKCLNDEKKAIKDTNKAIIKATKELDTLINKEVELNTIEDTCQNIDNTIKLYIDHTRLYDKVKGELEELKAQFKSLMPEVCPLCNK